MKYEFKELDETTLRDLIELSKKWVAEDCSYGMVANTAKDIQKPLCVAVDNNKIIGYVFGHFYTMENKSSYIDIGSNCFSVDEIYVLPEYRNQGVGKELFKQMEKRVKDSCLYVTLSTSTKDYKKILHFYVEELDMNFHSAFLIKSLND